MASRVLLLQHGEGSSSSPNVMQHVKEEANSNYASLSWVVCTQLLQLLAECLTAQVITFRIRIDRVPSPQSMCCHSALCTSNASPGEVGENPTESQSKDGDRQWY